MNKVQTPIERFYYWEATKPQDVFLRQPKNGQWYEMSWQEVGDKVRRIAAFIEQQHFSPKTHIAIYASNCADWVLVDLAIMMSGHISVPLYPGQDAESVTYILEHSEVKLIFCGQFGLELEADSLLPAELSRVGIQGCSIKTDYLLSVIFNTYMPLEGRPCPSPDDVFTLLYTSGTSGNPKGVMHSHGTVGHIMARMQRAWETGGSETRGRMISYLPLSHAAERSIIEMRALYSNSTISFSEGLECFSDEVQSVKPTFFFSVPRLWVKFKQAIDMQFPATTQSVWNDTDKAAVKAMLGLDCANIIITGSAPCPADVHNWFLSLGVNLREGYCMTENFCDGSFWQSEQQPLAGCSGFPLDSVDMKIGDNDEICFRSNGLMKGYYKEPEKTAEVLRDGWYHTGDTGRIDKNGLWVTGRISEVFKTTKGKFIKPARLENKLVDLACLQQVCVYGHGKDQPAPAATLSEDGLALAEGELFMQVGEAL